VIVAQVQPKVFVFENVPGLLTGENIAYSEMLIDRLREPLPGLRYGVAAGVLNAADFGVPQIRRRVFLIGIRDAPVQEIHGLFDAIVGRSGFADPSGVIPEGHSAWRTIADALPDWADDDGSWRRWISQDPKEANVLEEAHHSALEHLQ